MPKFKKVSVIAEGDSVAQKGSTCCKSLEPSTNQLIFDLPSPSNRISKTMSAKSTPKTRRLASSIVKFLQDSQKNGTLEAEDGESMEVAIGIISESFGLDTNPTEPADLVQIFDVYEKTREKKLV
jgi:Homodimerisation domain of SGTA